jgi:iron complex transport system substrate-binding protein
MQDCNRIICLTEETTELLYLLKEEHRIVGISSFTKRPVTARRDKPRVCSFKNGNLAKINKLEPDLIIGFSDVQADFSSDLIRAGHNVLITNQRSIEEIFSTLTILGRLVKKEPQTAELIKTWRDKLTRLSEKYKNVPVLKVFLQEWDEPILCGIQWCSELLSYLGAKHVFSKKSQAAAATGRVVSKKEIAKANPDVIIGSWCGKRMDKKWVKEMPEWQSVSAIQNDNIFEINSTIFLQPGPALFTDGLDELEKLLEKARTKIGLALP